MMKHAQKVRRRTSRSVQLTFSLAMLVSWKSVCKFRLFPFSRISRTNCIAIDFSIQSQGTRHSNCHPSKHPCFLSLLLPNHAALEVKASAHFAL